MAFPAVYINDVTCAACPRTKKRHSKRANKLERGSNLKPETKTKKKTKKKVVPQWEIPCCIIDAHGYRGNREREREREGYG